MFSLYFVLMSWQLEAHQTLEVTAAEEKEDYCKYFVREEDGPAEGCSDQDSVRAFLKSQPAGRGPSVEVQLLLIRFSALLIVV